MAEEKKAVKKPAPKKKSFSTDLKGLLKEAEGAYENDKINSEWIGFIDLLEKACKLATDKKLSR